MKVISLTVFWGFGCGVVPAGVIAGRRYVGKNVFFHLFHPFNLFLCMFVLECVCVCV